MTDHDDRHAQQPPRPHPDLTPLARLVGRWRVEGGAEGTITYCWLEGGFFLIQEFDLMHAGHPVKGIELIGHLQPFGEALSADIHSRAYDNVGNTLDYIYDLVGDTLTIWAGTMGSPANYRGTFSADGNTLAGA